MKYYKFLTPEHTGGCTSFDWEPYLPHDGQPGEWTPAVEGELKACVNGYHLVGDTQLLGNYAQAELYEAETRGDDLTAVDKYVARQVRLVRHIDTWNYRTLRLFACWCVRQVWDLLTDDRSKQAVEVSERYAVGDATQDELSAARAAAWAAAWDAARTAAWDAAWAATRAAAWAAARAAAWDDARAAAGDAAGDAARAAVWDATWAKQQAHLLEMLEIGGGE